MEICAIQKIEATFSVDICQAYGQGVFEILAQEECRTICVGKVVSRFFGLQISNSLI